MLEYPRWAASEHPALARCGRQTASDGRSTRQATIARTIQPTAGAHPIQLAADAHPIQPARGAAVSRSGRSGRPPRTPFRPAHATNDVYGRNRCNERRLCTIFCNGRRLWQVSIAINVSRYIRKPPTARQRQAKQARGAAVRQRQAKQARGAAVRQRQAKQTRRTGGAQKRRGAGEMGGAQRRAEARRRRRGGWSPAPRRGEEQAGKANRSQQRAGTSGAARWRLTGLVVAATLDFRDMRRHVLLGHGLDDGACARR